MKLDHRALALIKRLPDISTFKLKSCSLTDGQELLQILVSHKSLTVLALDVHGLEEQDLRLLRKAKNLEAIAVSGQAFTGKIARRLAKLPKLKAVTARYVRDGDKWLSAFAAKKLRGLLIVNTDINNAALAQFVEKSSVEDFAICDCKQISNEIISKLPATMKFETFNVSGTGITANGIRRLSKMYPKTAIFGYGNPDPEYSAMLKKILKEFDEHFPVRKSKVP